MKLVSAIIGAVLLMSPLTVAFAETGGERTACMADAFRVCSDAIPDRHSVFLCLMKNKKQLGDSCRQVMERHSAQRHRDSGRNARAEADPDEK